MNNRRHESGRGILEIMGYGILVSIIGVAAIRSYSTKRSENRVVALEQSVLNVANGARALLYGRVTTDLRDGLPANGILLEDTYGNILVPSADFNCIAIEASNLGQRECLAAMHRIQSNCRFRPLINNPDNLWWKNITVVNMSRGSANSLNELKDKASNINNSAADFFFTALMDDDGERVINDRFLEYKEAGGGQDMGNWLGQWLSDLDSQHRKLIIATDQKLEASSPYIVNNIKELRNNLTALFEFMRKTEESDVGAYRLSSHISDELKAIIDQINELENTTMAFGTQENYIVPVSHSDDPVGTCEPNRNNSIIFWFSMKRNDR
ncbi:MAG: hypothetical protein FWD15_02255 [Alphaproteobacteria bacterium]|nr:hypothetical protein [Alphaproteobacteria bacterium]